ncbi:MAG TPA: YigZ family protein [Bacteroidales bacterium]|nr:MAG: YigZ family protein [Bacteroidetes bacterium GWF2_33_38]OFY88863.1 MAG: YigZ family protein [Bacteroidetes bacterium RIFOXYA2_FULL_33_7]HBF87955.1 YigZ family protein [Bacteroidales bacterium]
MSIQDTYKTISQPSQGIYKDKGSKFIAFAYAVYSENEIKDIQAKLRKDYHDARHHCYAYRLGYKKEIFRTNDDGEPSNSAGKPILGQIQSHDLTNVLIVVVRYFGGVLLGVGGLINAYRTAAAEAIKNTNIIEKTVNDIWQINYEYQAMPDVMKIIKDDNIPQLETIFEINCTIKISVRKSLIMGVIDKLEKIETVKCNYLETI